MSPSVLKAITLTFAYYSAGRTLSDDVLKMYATDLADLPDEQVVLAYDQWRRSPKNRRFPLPADIRDLLQPETNPEDDAREAATRIITAVRTYGHSNADMAREFIGELGWEVVRLSGGWFNLCASMPNSESRIYLAQFRDLAQSIHHKTKNGSYGTPPALPERQRGVLSFEDRKKYLLAQANALETGKAVPVLTTDDDPGAA